MRKRWIVALGMLAMTLAIGGWAEAETCASLGLLPGAGVGRVSSVAGAAAAIGTSGFDDPTCDLIIDVSITPITNPLLIRAHDITIDPAGGPTPGVVVAIINDAANSVTTLTATETDLVISEASIKAHKTLKLVCQGTTPDCNITSRLSDLIAALDFANPLAGGDLFITAEGSVDIQTTNTHGGNILEINAKHGSLTLLCGPGEDVGCKDPVVSSKAVELCDTTGPGGVGPPDGIADFPCTVNFLTGADLTAVCFRGVPGVKCNGGSKEKRFTAQGDIDITGSTITAIDHITFTSRAGRWLAAGATLSGESIVAVIKGDGTSPSIDLSNATINTTAHTSITAGSGCIAPVLPLDPADTCINANGAKITASNIVMLANAELGVIDVCEATLDDVGADHPTLNGDSTPPYDDPPNRVVDTAAECDAFVAPDLDGNKGPVVIVLP